MVIFDSVKKTKIPFEPIEKGKASIYVCGPTVYDDAHLGHARSALAFDLLRRVLIASGYDVTFVKNFTDIDDKIIKKMNESGQSLEEITTYYINRYKEDMHAIGVMDADIEPKATESLQAIENYIQTLIDKKSAYSIDDGIYFDTTTDSEYLSLSHRHIEEDQTQARVEGNKQKKNAKDFALWKLSKEGEPCYSSPFGAGRPGWHIECSAMIKEHLAHPGDYQIDIHGGGADLLFPHHENEAAQTRCASGQHLAKYWMHNGFVTINGEKMSKSLGNSFFMKDALKVYDGEILRYYLLSTHYRANFNFSEEDLLTAKKRLDKLYRLKKRLIGAKMTTVNKTFKTSLLEALQDDMNISKTMALIDEMISGANEVLDANPKDKPFKFETNANLYYLETLLGIGCHDPYAYFQQGVSEEEKVKITALIEARNTAKKEKDFVKADAIRDELTAMNIQLMDTPAGTQWEKSEA